ETVPKSDRISTAIQVLKLSEELMRKLSYCALFFVLVAFLACGGGKKEESDETAGPTKAAPAKVAGGGNMYDPSKATGSITGKITYDGAKPVLAKLQMNADPYCLKSHPTPV